MQRTAIANSLSKQCRDKIAKGKEADYSPVHASNNVEAAGNSVARCFDIVAGVDGV